MEFGIIINKLKNGQLNLVMNCLSQAENLADREVIEITTQEGDLDTILETVKEEIKENLKNI